MGSNYEAQEPEVITPPEKGPPPFDDDEDTRIPLPGAPPFTGEDVEDAGQPHNPSPVRSPRPRRR